MVPYAKQNKFIDLRTYNFSHLIRQDTPYYQQGIFVDLIGYLHRLPSSVKKLGNFLGFIWKGRAASYGAGNTIILYSACISTAGKDRQNHQNGSNAFLHKVSTLQDSNVTTHNTII